MKSTYIFLLGFFMFLTSCRPKQHIQHTDWLLGIWVNKTNKGNIYEKWEKLNKQEYLAQSYMLNGGDTIFLESVRLQQVGDSLFYIPQVNNQNEGKSIPFVMTKLNRSEMIFENPSHDFPQVISYKKVGKNSLVAEISGMKDNKERKVSFPMERLK